MSIQFVYGRAGTGKSTFCLNTIKKYINNSLDQNFFIIVPEQFSYATEKALLETIDSQSTINSEVISFKRMADRIFKELRRTYKN